MDITLPGFKYLGRKIDNLGQKTKHETLLRNSDTPSKPLDKESPSPSPIIGSSSPIKTNISPLDFKTSYEN